LSRPSGHSGSYTGLIGFNPRRLKEPKRGMSSHATDLSVYVKSSSYRFTWRNGHQRGLCVVLPGHCTNLYGRQAEWCWRQFGERMFSWSGQNIVDNLQLIFLLVVGVSRRLRSRLLRAAAAQPRRYFVDHYRRWHLQVQFLQIWSLNELPFWNTEPERDGQTDGRTASLHNTVPHRGGGRITTGSWRRVARLSPCSITDFTSSSLPCSVESRQTSPSPMHDWNTISHN